jgi:hypothetical protein
VRPRPVSGADSRKGPQDLFDAVPFSEKGKRACQKDPGSVPTRSGAALDTAQGLEDILLEQVAKAGPYRQAINRRTATACLGADPWGNIPA